MLRVAGLEPVLAGNAKVTLRSKQEIRQMECNTTESVRTDLNLASFRISSPWGLLCQTQWTSQVHGPVSRPFERHFLRSIFHSTRMETQRGDHIRNRGTGDHNTSDPAQRKGSSLLTNETPSPGDHGWHHGCSPQWHHAISSPRHSEFGDDGQ